MKKLYQYIQEKLHISNYKDKYEYYPKDKSELVKIISELIKEYGNKVNLNNIDTSKIYEMDHLFQYENLPNFEGDISKWNVSNVEFMEFMFYDSKFNGDISKWDVSKVKNMGSMFYNSKFNGDISSWNVVNVKNMRLMFANSPLEKNPPKWYKV